MKENETFQSGIDTCWMIVPVKRIIMMKTSHSVYKIWRTWQTKLDTKTINWPDLVSTRLALQWTRAGLFHKAASLVLFLQYHLQTIEKEGSSKGFSQGHQIKIVTQESCTHTSTQKAYHHWHNYWSWPPYQFVPEQWASFGRNSA